jgi:hypothetical protein
MVCAVWPDSRNAGQSATATIMRFISVIRLL